MLILFAERTKALVLQIVRKLSLILLPQKKYMSLQVLFAKRTKTPVLQVVCEPSPILRLRNVNTEQRTEETK